MDNPIPMTPATGDSTDDEIDESIHTEQVRKDDVVVLA